MAFGFIGKNTQNKIPQARGLGLRDLSKYGMLKLPLRRQGAVHNGRRLAPLPEKGGTMRFTLTSHIGHKTVTLSLVVKSNNRHPGR